MSFQQVIGQMPKEVYERLKTAVELGKWPDGKPLTHGKLMTIDGIWTTIGSTNLDSRALHNNQELNLSVTDAEFTRTVEDRIFNNNKHALKPYDASTFSTWDTYRALHPWLILTQPAQAKKLIDDVIRQTQQSLYGPPVWTLQGKETGVMIGWHGTPIMAEAMVKGSWSSPAAERSSAAGAAAAGAKKGPGFRRAPGHVDRCSCLTSGSSPARRPRGRSG